jgi:hypothetical protein
MAWSENGAYQVTTAATLLPLPPSTTSVYLLNLGPNDVYVGASAATCTSALGLKVPANGGELALDKDVSQELYVLAATANQASPADLRWMAKRAVP